MKKLYHQQLQELSGQFVAHLGIGWLLSYPLMGPIVKASSHQFFIRLPFTLTIAMFLGVQAQYWERPNKTFHELMSQPAPHGSYLRRSVREHFPVWWSTTSAALHKNGYSLPEMNEYDRATTMPKTHTAFDTTML